jgi:hypothetical protein
MFHQVRVAMQNGELKPFEGLVEMDETFVGGKPRKYPPKLYDPATYSEKILTTRLGDYKNYSRRHKRAKVRARLHPDHAS